MPIIEETDNKIVRIDPNIRPLQTIILKDIKDFINSLGDTIFPFCIKLNLLGLFVCQKTLRHSILHIFYIFRYINS